MHKQNKYLSALRNRRSEELEDDLKRSEDIAETIVKVLEEKGMNKKDLARLLNKNPSEITKYLSGQHNFTISTVGKIGRALKCKLLYTHQDLKEKASQAIIQKWLTKDLYSDCYSLYKAKPKRGETARNIPMYTSFTC